MLLRLERIIINAQWLCTLRTLPVLLLALWSLGPFLGHGPLDLLPPTFCLTFAVFHVRVCSKSTAILPSHFDFSTDLLPAEHPSMNIWEMYTSHPLLLSGQHAVAYCANRTWRNNLLDFWALVTFTYPRTDQINREIITKT